MREVFQNASELSPNGDIKQDNWEPERYWQIYTNHKAPQRGPLLPEGGRGTTGSQDGGG